MLNGASAVWRGMIFQHPVSTHQFLYLLHTVILCVLLCVESLPVLSLQHVQHTVCNKFSVLLAVVLLLWLSGGRPTVKCNSMDWDGENNQQCAHNKTMYCTYVPNPITAVHVC